jgi:hypothetical protein
VQAETGELGEAARLLQRALNIRARCFGPEHLETAATMINLSTVQVRSFLRARISWQTRTHTPGAGSSSRKT